MVLRKSWLFTSLVFLVAAFFLNRELIRQTQRYKSARESYAAQLHYEKRLLDLEEWFDGGGWEKKHQAALAAADDQERRWSAAIWAGGLFALCATVYLGLCAFLFGPGGRESLFPASLLIVALACLHAGLFAPMLEIAAFQEDLSIPLRLKTGLFSLNIDYRQTFPGEMYFYYQSKSVAELIALLLRQHNFVVGLSILCFSIVLPLGKSLLALYGFLGGGVPSSRPMRWLLLQAGKWSMADVFVVAVFLGFLAFQNLQTGIRTESRVLPGLYFFLGYVILAILSSVFAAKRINQ